MDYDWDKIDACHKKILAFFDGDPDKMELWFTTPNPPFGMITPDQLINSLQIDKLIKFIDTSLDENKRE